MQMLLLGPASMSSSLLQAVTGCGFGIVMMAPSIQVTVVSSGISPYSSKLPSILVSLLSLSCHLPSLAT